MRALKPSEHHTYYSLEASDLGRGRDKGRKGPIEPHQRDANGAGKVWEPQELKQAKPIPCV